MSLLIPVRRYQPDQELIDQPDVDPELLRQDLRNLRLINRWFGGWSATRGAVAELLRRNVSGPISLLDLATGSGDQPFALWRWARKRGLELRITAVDRSPQILEFARQHVNGRVPIVFKQGDILALDYPDAAFDIVTCCLALHHFTREHAVHLLREMRRLSRIGFVVNDLNRSWPAAWTTWLYTHLTTRNPLTLNDSYISVLRAFTPQELREMADEAGIVRFAIRTRPFFRLILIGEP